MNQKEQKAYFGGGCFWCTEAVFQRLKGVSSVAPGYAGGSTANPSYEDVTTGQTGHAEVVEVTFDPKIISYGALLDVFFHTHDPTTLNYQGNDAGTQYRSIILYASNEQKDEAEQLIETYTKEEEFPRPIVTEVASLDTFYPAESYHVNYYNKNSYQPYCSVIIGPKIAKLMEKYGKMVQKDN